MGESSETVDVASSRSQRHDGASGSCSLPCNLSHGVYHCSQNSDFDTVRPHCLHSRLDTSEHRVASRTSTRCDCGRPGKVSRWRCSWRCGEYTAAEHLSYEWARGIGAKYRGGPAVSKAGCERHELPRGAVYAWQSVLPRASACHAC